MAEIGEETFTFASAGTVDSFYIFGSGMVSRNLVGSKVLKLFQIV